jgi:hypothetical protein
MGIGIIDIQMADFRTVWQEALPKVREGVTGVGVWTALNAAVPLAAESGQFVLGLPRELGELSGHLRMALTKRLIETTVSEKLGEAYVLRVIDGTEDSDWELEKRRDAEKARLNEQAMNRMREEMASRTNWDTIYEQLGRQFAATPQRSLPQNRARFYEQAIEVVAEARRNITTWDDLQERNFARCIERLAQYAEAPSVLVAADVLKRSGEL